jgi:hypothetical protein
MFVPNQKGKKIRIIIIIILCLIIILLLGYFFYYPSETVNVNATKKIESSNIKIDKLADVIVSNEDYTINLKVLDKNIDLNKIKWTSSNNDIVSLNNCSKNSCIIKGKAIGETTIKAFYDETNYDQIIIKVIESKKIYIYQYLNIENKTLYASFNYDKDMLKYAKLVTEYVCVSKDCQYYGVSANHILIKENNNYYIYDLANESKEKIDYDLSSYSNLLLVESNNKVLGILLDNSKFYNLAKDVITVSTASDEETFSYSDYLSSNNQISIIDYRNKITNIYDINTGSIVKKFNEIIDNLDVIKIGNIKYFMASKYLENDSINTIYDQNYNKVLDNILMYAIKDNCLYVIFYDNDKEFSKYDSNLKLVSISKEYQRLTGLDKRGYVIALEQNNNIDLIDFNENIIHTYLTLNDNLYFHSMLSGYYTENGKDGFYVVIGDTTLGNNDDGFSKGYELYYNPDTGASGKIDTEIGGYAKPVLYLYPTKNNTKVEISFAHPEYLTTTYPQYIDKWVVTANKDGSLYDQNKRYYYGLYWEEMASKKVSFKSGFYVTKANAINFLEDKLNKIGLTEREANEFIMYWLPILEKNQKSLVYFELTSSREEFNKLNIKPAPDSLLRVAIHVKKVNKKTDIKEEILPKFTRKGFTVVEWGGVNYK